MAFDIDGAKKAGYSDTEIADYLGKEQRFDVAAARKAGYSDAELIAHLHSPAKRDAAPQAREPAMGDGAAGSQPQGQKIPGTIDLTKRKVLNNPDGSISTESSFSIGTDQGEVLLPSVIDGKRVSMRDAIAHYEQTGEHLGIFDSPENADAYAESLHQQQGQRYGGAGRKRVAYVPGMSPDEVTQTESELNAPPPAAVPKPVETGIMAAIKDPEFWGIAGRRALDMGNAAASLIAKPKPSDGPLLPENYGSDLQIQIGANIQSKITGATEFEAERQKAYAQKRIGQASIMPQLIQDYRQKGIPMRENPLLRGYAETLDIPQKDLAQWTDDFLMDWSLYANMSPTDRQTVLLEGKKVLAQANSDLEDTGKQRDIIQTVQQNSRPDMKQWSAPALIFDAATSIPDLLVAAGGAIAGGPAAGLLVMGASMAPSFYAEGKSNGLDHRSAGTYAALMSAAELAPELPVAEAIARTPQGKAIMRKLVGNLVDTTGGKIAGTAALESLSEMFTEVLEQGIQSGMIDQHLSLKQSLENIARAGTVGAMMGAPFGALPGGHQETPPANSQVPEQPPQAESPVPPASPEVPQEPTVNQQVDGGTAIAEVPHIQPEVANVKPAVSPEIPASPDQSTAVQQDTGGQPTVPERQAPATIDRRSLADAFTTGEDGAIDAAQAARAVRAQVAAALDAGQVVTQGGGRTRTPVTDAAQVDVKAVLAGLSRIKIGEQVDQTKISDQPKPEGGESNGQKQTLQAGQREQAPVLDEPTLADKAKAKSKEAVTIQPDEDGFTLVINGERGATYPTIEQAREEKRHAIETLQQHADRLVDAEKQRAAEIDTAAHEAATSPQNNLPEPTPAQIDAGNYQKGHLRLHGLDISIENPKGSIRRSKPGALKTWEREMTAHYGYVRGSEGADGDHVDVFVGDNHNSDKAYVIDQVINGKFDEHKVVVGVDSEEAARKLYQSNYQKGWKGLGAITEMPVEQFKSWVKTEDAKKPLAWKAEPAKKSIYREASAEKGFEENRAAIKERGIETGDTVHFAVSDGSIQTGTIDRVLDPRHGTLAINIDGNEFTVAGRELYKDKAEVPPFFPKKPAKSSAPVETGVKTREEPAKEVPNKAQVTPSANTVFTDDAYAKAKALLKSKLGNINTGLDPEVIQAGITAAGYHIEKGARTFAAYSKAMIDDLGEAIRPYLRSWYEAVRWHPAATAFTADMDSAATIDSQPTQADTQPKVTDNVPSTNANLERDSGNTGTENAPVAEPVQVAGSAEGSEAGRGQVDSARRGHPDDQGVPHGSPAVARELGDQSLHRAHEQDGPAEFPARDTYGERSDSPGIEGVPPETVTAEQVDAFAVDLHEDARKRAEQRKADGIALNGSLENVRATLPYLQPGQQEDVHKTETRFAKPDGYGYLLTNGTGTGKAQPLDAGIMTPSGWKQMGDIVVGDRVISVDGLPTRVTAIHPQGEKEIFRVTFSDGSSTECCDEHLWTTQTLYQRRKATTHPTARFVQPTAKSLAEIRATLDKRHFIPIVAPVVLAERQLPLNPYVLGALIGDGNFTHSAVTISTQDQQIADRISALLPLGVLCVRMTEQRCPTFRITDGAARRRVNGTYQQGRVQVILEDLKLRRLKSVSKFIPRDYLMGSIEQRIELLQGLMDTDGYADHKNNSAYFTTVSAQLATDMVELVQSLGGVATTTRKVPSYKHLGEVHQGQLAYTICVRLPNEIQPFGLERKRLANRAWGLPKRAIVSIESVGKKLAQCIAVDNPSRLYVTDQFIVTHNTFSGLGAIKRMARRGKTNTLVVVPDVKIASDWIASAKALGLNITPLEDTKDAGRGVTITTYANLGQNDELAKRSWDFVVADEAHQLMQSANGDQTLALNSLRAITMHPRGEYSRFEMLNREDIGRQKALSDEIIVNANLMRNASHETVAGLQVKNTQLQKELDALTDKLKGKLEEVKAEIAAAQGAGRTRMLALTATPFAYEKTIDWAEGYLFDYGKADETGRSYNRGDARDQFFMRHFGYRMRYGKLTEPDAKVDRGLMQRQFNGWLKKNGVLSGRMLDVPHDYDRRFVLVNSAVGNQIDRAIEYIDDQRKAFGENKANKAEENGWAILADVLQNELYGKLGHLVRRYLLEAIKAKEVIPHLREHLAKNRKIVVFHDFKKGGARNPFDFEPIPAEQTDPRDAKKAAAYNSAVMQFRAQFPDLIGDNLLSDLISPIQRFKKEFPNVLLINGDERKSDLLERYRKFQDDETGPVIALVQSDKNKGWSGHDATGKNQRVLFNLGLPTQPTKSIQQEGRIYRIGQVSNAIFRYLNTGTNWERWAFAQTIAERASAAENLGMGEQARALKDAYIAGFEESGDYPAGHEGEGTGGKERDRLSNNALTEFDRARAFYFGTQKKDSRTKAQEGADYFATAEPLGLKMVQWADPRGGEDFLEPSAGHGAIARWAGEKLTRTAIEPSNTLGSRLAMVFDGKIIRGDFESHNLVNKYDTIVMNPPFGSGGRTAVDHVEKAARHLRDGGRIVALIPTGPAADAKFDKWFYDEGKEKVVNNSSARGLYLVADIKLPGVAFERAGTKVMTRVVVLEKPIKGTEAPQQITRDLTDIDNINKLFDRIEDMDVAPRAKPVEEDQQSRLISHSEALQQRKETNQALAQAADASGSSIVEHITGTGKKLRGVIRKDLTINQAKEIDPWTFKKNGGYYIREKHLAELNAKYPGSAPLMDLAEDKEAADANAVRRAMAQLAGHEVDPIERKSAVIAIGNLRKQLESGKLSSVEFAQEIESLHARMLEATSAKRMSRIGTERVRGPDFIRQKLIEAKRRGDIDAETSDFAEWFILKNPALVDELGISIKTAGPTEKGSAGQYMPVSRIMKLIKDRAKPTTAVHEILHHLERLMPNEMQAAIRKEYWKQLTAAREKAVKAKDEALIKYLDDAAKASITQDKTAMDDMRDALLKGKVERENYQFFNPSEFWSVNMTNLLSARYQVRNSIWKRIKQWIKEAVQHARMALRLPSDAPMIKILDELIEGSDGKSTAKFMLHESTLYENNAYRDIGDDQPSFEAPKPGKEVGLSRRFKTDADTFLYNWQDKHIDTKRVVQAIEKLKGQISDDKDPYMAEELYHQRAAYRTERFLNDELKPVLEAVKAANLSVADLEQYLWARHAKERNETIAERNPELPDGGSGMLTADAESYLAELTPAKREKLESLAERVDKMIEGTRNTLVGYGLESQATMDLRKAAWPSYVPLHRADYENESSYGIGQGFSVKGPDSKAALGSTRKVANILAEIALQRERAIVRGEKNRVAAALFGLAKSHPNDSWWSTERLPRIRFLNKDNQVVSMIDPKWKSRENVVVVRFPNKAGRIVERGVIFNERNPRAMRMAEALKNLDTPAMEGAIGIMSKFSRYIASINTQYNPVFGLRNLQRDIQEGMLNLTNTAINGKQAKIAKYATLATRGIWQDARAKRHGKHPSSEWAKWFEEMEAEGGTTGHRQLFESSADRAEKILDEFKQLDEGYVGKKSLRAIGNWLSDYNLMCESAVRVAAYRTAREAGLTKARSASIAKNLTINFNRKGRNSQQANALYAFFNAKVQGQARFLQTLAGPAGKAIIAGGLLIGIMQAAALAMLGFDDNDPPEFVKQQNLIIPFGSEGRYLIWNMPQSMQLLVSLGRIPTEAAIRDTRSAYSAMMSMFSTVADSFNPMGASTPLQTILPTAVDPIGALAENENWNGQPIYQEKFDSNDPAPGFTRSKDTASALSKVVARSLNYMSGGSDYVAGKLSPTPDQIDYLLDQALGGPGREFSKAQQTVSSIASGENLPDYKVPLWGHYFGNVNSKSSERARFYDLARRGRDAKAELEGRAGEAAVDREAAKARFDAYLSEHPEASITMSAIDAANQVSKIRKAKRQAAANGQPQSVLNQYDEQAASIISQTLARDRQFRQEARQ